MLARTVPRPMREKLATFLEFAKSKILDASEETLFKEIEELVPQAQNEVGLTGKPTSMMSKFAFSLRPDICSPYDARAREALRKDTQIAYKGLDHDYVSYMDAYTRFKAELIASNVLIHPMDYTYKGISLNENLFWSRVADKYLMVLGGFNIETIRKEASPYDI